MKVLLATQKPFAAKAVEGIVSILTEGGHEVVKLEKYPEQAFFWLIFWMASTPPTLLIHLRVSFITKMLNTGGVLNIESLSIWVR